MTVKCNGEYKTVKMNRLTPFSPDDHISTLWEELDRLTDIVAKMSEKIIELEKKL